MADERTDKLLRKSFQEIQNLRAALRARDDARSEPIAIVGMACRTPGDVTDPEGYWALLDAGRDAIRPFPNRWRPAAVFDADPDAVGKSYTREGGYLEDVDRFDAEFFGISPKEARQMDPQQRLVLEVAWEALERAGIVPATLRASRTGVYVGAMPGDYGLEGFSLEALDGYRTTGTIGSVTAGRVSYLLGLHGPAMTVDTACSSSLVALHLACTALRLQECDLALTAGVTVMSTPALFVEFSRLRASSPDGRCKAFSAEANGASWAEGCGAVVLKRLSDARRDGDPILALVRATAVNQDGRSQGLTAPNGPSQARLIRQALAACGLEPEDVDAIEAHGTGTSLGDPIEAGALAEIFAEGRSDARPVWLGSAKSNIGHAQAAAGLLGLIKMVLALEHERLPRTLHVQRPSDKIEWQRSGLALLCEPRPWRRSPERPRRAGVSSFGISGTNAHAVLEEAPDSGATGATEAPSVPLLLSGRDEDALRAQARKWITWLRQDRTQRLADVCAAAAVSRTHFTVRAALDVSSPSDAVEALTALANGQADERVRVGRAREKHGPVFVFSGHGSQWHAMGRELLEQSPSAAQAVRECDRALRPHLGWSVESVLRGEDTPGRPALDAIECVQPCLFAMALALSAAWRSFGIQPSAVVGHSQGEIAASVVSGALSVEDGARLVALRSRLLARLTGTGTMVAVELPVQEVERMLAEDPAFRDLSVAVVNAPSSTVVAGSGERLEIWARALEARGVFCRAVAVDCAGHSADMDGLLPELKAGLAALTPRPATVPMISTVTGHPVAGEMLDAEYWSRNLREPVRLDRALACAFDAGHDVYIEVSPHPVLGIALAGACAQHGAICVGSLQRASGSLRTLLAQLTALHLAGVDVDWNQVVGRRARPLPPLPTYAFQRSRYWLEANAAPGDLAAAGLEPAEHPLLGACLPLADGGLVWSGRLSFDRFPWLADHGVYGTALVPGTGLLEVALSAGRQVRVGRVLELSLEAPLVVPTNGARVLQVQLEAPSPQGTRRVTIHSRPTEEGAEWTLHATGLLAPEEHAGTTAEERAAAWPPPPTRPVAVEDLYERLDGAGYHYGPSFRGLRAVWQVGDVVCARVEAPESIAGNATGYGVHPALLDAALHALFTTRLELDADRIWLPVAWSDVDLGMRGASELRVTLTPEGTTRGAHEREFFVRAADAQGQLAVAGRLRVRSVPSSQVRASLRTPSNDLHALEWREVAPPESPDTKVTLVLTDDAPLARELCADRLARVSDLQARLDAGAPAPERIVLDVNVAGDDSVIERAHHVAEVALLDLCTLLADERLSQAEFVWVARCTSQSARLGVAALRGLLRSTRSEHPDRLLRSVEVRGESIPIEQVSSWLRCADEPEVRLEHGLARAPRLRRPATEPPPEPRLDPTHTVLITGGLGELGQWVSEHLVRDHGVRHLVITSRRPDAPERAAPVVASLLQAGATSVEVVRCDVSHRDQVEALLASLRGSAPLGAVFHLAAVVEDRPLEKLDPETLHRVLRPKLDGAWNLYRSTRSRGLSHFVLFSSVAGVVGTLGQAAYSAANVFLDELAEESSREGVRAQSLAWGLWSPGGAGPTARLGDADLSRMARQGLLPFEPEAGLALLDIAMRRPEAVLVPARFDYGKLAARAVTHPTAMLADLIARDSAGGRTPPRDTRATLRDDMLKVPEPEREQALVLAVREAVATVLHVSDPAAIDVDLPLRDMGLDSLMSLELKNGLSRAMGEALPAALAFNWPTVRAIAGFLGELLETRAAPPESARIIDEETVRRKLRRVSVDALRQSGLLDALMAQPDALEPEPPSGAHSDIRALLSPELEEDSLIEMAEQLLESGA